MTPDFLSLQKMRFLTLLTSFTMTSFTVYQKMPNPDMSSPALLSLRILVNKLFLDNPL